MNHKFKFNKAYYNSKQPPNPKLNLVFVGLIVVSIYTYHYYRKI